MGERKEERGWEDRKGAERKEIMGEGGREGKKARRPRKENEGRRKVDGERKNLRKIEV